MNELNVTLGSRIRTVRSERGMTQEQLALLSGIDRGQISRIESGAVDVQVSTVEKIAEALKLDAGSLFTTSKYSTHPFVKWAGGKTQLLDRLTSMMPRNFNDYYEPFIGGGALLFRVNPSHPHINDMNDELLSAYRCFRSDETYKSLIEKLDYYDAHHSEENYMAVRSLDRDPEWVKFASDVDKAARMIYLNKSCFNGLFRVNSKGYFNVPSGKKKTVNAYDRDNFENIRAYFRDANPVITHSDFAEAVASAKAGDFVYFDPPYDTWDEKNSFTSYDKEGFGKKDQARLADCYRELDKRGVKLMLSNHNTSYINELYKGFDIHVVNAKRMINSDANGRGDVQEVIIKNF